MSRLTVDPTAVSESAPRRPGRSGRSARSWRERLGERAVRARLSGISHGCIQLRDDTRAEIFGSGALEGDLHVTDPRFYRAVLTGGALGAADAWAEGWWTSRDLTALLRVFVQNLDATDGVERGWARCRAPFERIGHALRANSRRGSQRNIHAHYDLGNDFFALFLDPTMTYSAGVFESPESTMADASTAKLDRICRKAGVDESTHVLEIGTGWGSFALHAASTYGCRVTTTTISREQHALATERVRAAGLSDRVDVRLQDYRELDGQFDRVVSIEMIEAVGHRFLPTYFAAIDRLLKRDGRAVLQAITMPAQRYARYLRSVDFIRAVVFPGSCCPSMPAMADAWTRGSALRLIDHEDITPHYAETLARWREQFVAARDEVRAMGYPESFIRQWLYYLCYCEAGFAEHYTGSVQLVLAPIGADTTVERLATPRGARGERYAITH